MSSIIVKKDEYKTVKTKESNTKKDKKIDPVLQFSDPRLRQISPPVSEELFDSAELQNWVERLNLARQHYGGVGIAAPQIGLFHRLIVVEFPEYDRVGFGLVKAQPLTALINPEIVYYSEDKMKAAEGCLSVLGYEAFLVRPAKIGVVAWNLKGERTEFEADSLYARVIQHELDHLNGILYPDLVTNLRDIRKIQAVEVTDPVLAHNNLIERPQATLIM
jgi:peptide deformylase